jgi:hypothetical protein
MGDSRTGRGRRTNMSSTTISQLFQDSGGVLLTNGWDRPRRREAAHKGSSRNSTWRLPPSVLRTAN